MSYIEIKTVNGRLYKYLRRTVWDGKRYRHINLKYLGAVEPIYKVKKMRKTNASIYVRLLQPHEIENLEKEAKSHSAFTRDRAKILLLSSKRLTAKESAEKIGCCVKKVRTAIKEFNARGMDALQRGKSRGAPQKFTKEQKARIVQTMFTDPKRLNLHFTTWSIRKLKKYCEENRIVKSISIGWLWHIIKKENISWKKSRRFQYSNDPEFLKKNF